MPLGNGRHSRKEGTMWNKIKAINYRHYLAILLILATLCISLYCYDLAVGRTASTVVDLVDSFRYYFEAVSHAEDAAPARISLLPTVDLSSILPWSVEEIQRKLQAFGGAFFQKENFQAYLIVTVNVLNVISLFLLPSILLLWCLVRLFYAWLLRETKPKKKKYKKGDRPPKGEEEYLPVPEKTPLLSCCRNRYQ